MSKYSLRTCLCLRSFVREEYILYRPFMNLGVFIFKILGTEICGISVCGTTSNHLISLLIGYHVEHEKIYQNTSTL